MFELLAVIGDGRIIQGIGGLLIGCLGLLVGAFGQKAGVWAKLPIIGPIMADKPVTPSE